MTTKFHSMPNTKNNGSSNSLQLSPLAANQDEHFPSSQPPLKKAFSAPVESEHSQESFVQRFVPDMVVERLFNGGAIQGQELSRYQESVVGFFDVSGFSALARDLEQADRTRSEKALKKRSASSYISQHSISGKGAEELVRQLNETFSALIETIRAAGGDIIKFAGDAILVVWLCDDIDPMPCQLLRAAQCAVACTGLKSDQSKLGLHVGIGCGELVAAHVGGTFGRWEFFIAGESCTQSAVAESHAGVNQVVISPQARVVIMGSKYLRAIEGSEVADGFFLLNRIEYQQLGPAPKPRYSLSSDPIVAKAAEGYVPGPVRDALKSGGSSSASVGGLRKLTVIFFKLYDVVLPKKFDEESEKQFLEQCQNQAKLVQNSAYHYYATLRQFILDDKGFVAIVALGLPPYFHEDNAVRAVKVAKRLIEHHKVRAAAGICTGTVFCGVVGSSKRAEYSVAGSCINLAARLMAKAGPGIIWCDTTTKMEAESLGQIRFEQFPSLPFKGFDQPVDIYGPVMATLNSPLQASPVRAHPKMVANGEDPSRTKTPIPEVLNMDGLAGKKTPSAVVSSISIHREDSAYFRKRKSAKSTVDTKKVVTLVGAETEQVALSKAAFIGTGSVRCCFLEGDAGSGKTRLAEWVARETTARRTIISAADSSETNTPFFVWRTILQSILAVTRGNTNKGENANGSFFLANNRASSSASDGNKSKSLNGKSRKRGFSAELTPPTTTTTTVTSDTFSSLYTKPIPQHRRQLSGERVPSPLITRGHKRAHSNSSIPADGSPLRHEATLQPQRSIRTDSVLGDLPTATVDEAEDGGLSTADEEEEEDDHEDSEDDHPIIAHPPPPGNRSSLARMSLDTSSSNSPHNRLFSFFGTAPANGAYLPDHSAVLESLHDTGRLKGRRLSCLHAIIPNLVIPSELDIAEAAAPPPPQLSTAALLSAKLGATPQRRTSFSSKGLVSSAASSTPQPGGGSLASISSPVISSHETKSYGLMSPAMALMSPTLSSLTGGGNVLSAPPPPPEPLSEAQACMELVTLLLEECGVLGTTLIIIENAHYMDKQSWELLKKCCDLSPPSWKNEHRVRFVVTYRPFATAREHPLQMMLNGPLHTVSSVSSLPSVLGNSGGAGMAPPPSAISLGPSVSAPSAPQASGNPTSLASIPQSSIPMSITSDGGDTNAIKVSAPPAFERVSSSLKSAIGHHTRRRSIETPSLYSPAIRASNSEVANVSHADEDPSVIRVYVNPFTQREAGVFLSNVHRVAIGPNLLSFIYKKSKGNPRALLDCFKALQDQDLITVDPSSGTVEETTSLEDIGDMVFVIPLHLRAQLQQQVDKLMNREQLILRLSTVIGSTFPISLLKWLYKQRVFQLTSPQQVGPPSSVSGDQMGEQSDDTISMDFESGLKELRERGYIRPFLTSNYEMRDVDSGDYIGHPGSTSASVGNDEDWLIESDMLRFLVYSQMLHTARREVHGLILDWYVSQPTAVRSREDPSVLGNHAVGAERPMLAFHCFREGLRRVVLKEEVITRGTRLWQSCVDLLDDPSSGFDPQVVVAHRISIDVLMGHVCLQNESWDEAKMYLIRAVEAATQVLSLESRQAIGIGCLPWPILGWFRISSGTSNNNSSLTERNALAQDAFARDPLNTIDLDPLIEVKGNLNLARSLLRKIQDLQDMHTKLISSLKTFSLREIASQQ